MTLEWGWVSFGLLMLGLEILAPGFFLLFIGAAALMTGAIFMMVSGNWQAQAFSFALLTLGFVFIAWKLKFYANKSSDSPHLNDRTSALIGQVYPLHSAIINGKGSVKIGDSLWVVVGEELEAASSVRIVEIKSDILTVEAV